jgi:hypothetical protein
MKRWALIVVGLYAAALLAIVGPLFFLIDRGPDSTLTEMYKSPATWIWVLVMALCQWALLLTPVRVANRRPTTRRSLVLPVVVGGFLAVLLLAGAVICVRAVIWGDSETPGWHKWAALALAVATWSGWSFVFYRMGRAVKPEDVITAQCRSLFRGSVLELLVAVPSHVVVRSRHLCCADGMTSIGITFGIAVMLLSFGPALFFLFVARWRRLHPRQAGDVAES